MGSHAQLTARDISGPYTQLLTNLQGDNGQEWLDALNRFLRKENPWPANGQVPKTARPSKVLASASSTQVELSEPFKPEQFFTNRKGLYLMNDMQRVLKGAEPVDSAEAATLSYSNLSKDAYDREIKAELLDEHEVELWHISVLIESQLEGEAGPLLTNGYANIFYVRGFAVGVRLIVHRSECEWHVRDWRLVGGQWDADDRVFSRN